MIERQEESSLLVNAVILRRKATESIHMVLRFSWIDNIDLHPNILHHRIVVSKWDGTYT